MENYREITLMDSAYKIYAEILRNRLDKHLEEKHNLDATQIEFRNEMGTVNAI